MVQLSVFEEVRDKVSRMLPTAYMEIVEECTAPHLSIPIYEHVMFLCDSANSKPDTVDEVVRALRRRINDDNAAVRHLLILLVDAMVKNCASPFHVEISKQKGFLRDLVNMAADPPTSARGMQAKEAALTLVLNLSIWFAGHPDPACHILTTLANDVRATSGPNAFEGIRPDANTHIRVTVPPRNPSAGARPQSGPRRGDGQQPRERPRDTRNYVDAVVVKLPTEAMLSGMLDTCVAFSEYLENAPTTPEGDIIHDDVVSGFNEKLTKDHNYVTILLSSNLQVDRDVLRTVSDSQSSVIASLNKKRSPATGGAAQETVPSAAAPSAAPLKADVHPVAQEAKPATTAAAAPPPDMDDIFGAPAPAAAAAAPQPPGMDDIFGEAQAVAAPAVPQPAEHQQEEHEEPSVEASASGPSPSAAAAEEQTESAPAREEEEEQQAEEQEEPAEPAVEEEEHGGDAEAEKADEESEEAAPHDEEAEAPVDDGAAAEPEEEGAEAAAEEPPVAPAPVAVDDDDDFDAFLDGKLSK